MKTTAIIAAVIAILLGIATWYYSSAAATAQNERDAPSHSRDELLVRASNLEKEKAELTNQLESQIARLSKEKEEELNRLRSTYDTLVTDLKSEIEQGQITITKMADRLSVSMVDKILFSSWRGRHHGRRAQGPEAGGRCLEEYAKQDRPRGGSHGQCPDQYCPCGEIPDELGALDVLCHQCRPVPAGEGRDRTGAVPGGGWIVGIPSGGSKCETFREKSERRIEIALLPDSKALPGQREVI